MDSNEWMKNIGVIARLYNRTSNTVRDTYNNTMSCKDDYLEATLARLYERIFIIKKDEHLTIEEAVSTLACVIMEYSLAHRSRGLAINEARKQFNAYRDFRTHSQEM
jgi:hypothetical protein